MIEVSSPAFRPGESIPTKYTCDGWGVSPPLQWSNVPEGTNSLALLVDDPDAPNKRFVHWLVVDLPSDIKGLEEGEALPRDAWVAETDAGTLSYYGPCPPSGRHHYRFHLYALDSVLGLAPEDLEDFFRMIEGHVLDEGELVGTYERASLKQGSA